MKNIIIIIIIVIIIIIIIIIIMIMIMIMIIIIIMMWRVRAKVIPIIVGALGTVPKKLLYFLDQLNIKYDIGTIQKTVVLGSAQILLKFLSVTDLMERK